MGRFLVIGIATSIGVCKQQAEKDFRGLENYKAVLENVFNQSGIYQWNETEDFFGLKLKPDIAEKEWVDFIHSFFDLRYSEREQDIFQIKETLESIANEHDLEGWLKLAGERNRQCYQDIDFHYYPIDNPYSFYGHSYLGMELMVLSLDGKILMECYNRLFNFFTRIIRERLSNYRLSDSLFVYITE